MVSLTLEPIQLEISNGKHTLNLKINSERGIFTLMENEDLIAEEETSYFSLYSQECVIDRCRLTEQEVDTAMYFLFANKLIQLLTSGSQASKPLIAEEILFNNLLTQEDFVRFYTRLSGKTFSKVYNNLTKTLEGVNRFRVSSETGGLFNNICEHYLTTGNVLVTSSQGIALLEDKTFVDVRLFDTGDLRWNPTNFYSKVSKLLVSNYSSINPIRVELLSILKLYAFSEIITELNVDQTYKEELISETVNILLI